MVAFMSPLRLINKLRRFCKIYATALIISVRKYPELNSVEVIPEMTHCVRQVECSLLVRYSKNMEYSVNIQYCTVESDPILCGDFMEIYG